MKKRSFIFILLAFCVALLGGCGNKNSNNNVTEIEMVQYKPEAVEAFNEIEQKFNETHSDIQLKIYSPNEAMVVLKTRFVRNDYPDIVGIGGDINYANFLDADLFMDISDFDGISDVKPAYLEMEKELELVPKDGVYALPYAANAAGILYNKDMFEEHGWSIPTTWDEFTELCETIQAEGITPLYFGFKDTWTTLAPWNAIAVNLAPSDTCARVNRGETTFSKEYYSTAVKIKELLKYCEANPYAYGYNDACTAFARGESAMYPIGSYAVPQILSTNPDMNIDSFVFPANENAEDNILNSGVDLQFSVMKQTKNKDAVYEVMRFLYQDDIIQIYLDNQNSIPCKEGDFKLPSMLDGMSEYISDGKMADFQDHHYPSEMSTDAIIQTFLMDSSENAVDTFLTRFDKEWTRYNRDIIRKLEDYEEVQQ
jgi:raffinose/stachyose/melibiose transport system substrate-binding protein